MTEIISHEELRTLTKGKSKNRESQLQAECVRWFRLAYPKLMGRLFAIPNGGYRHKITAAILKREGAMAGVSDLFLAIPTYSKLEPRLTIYHGMFIEMKDEDGELSQYQKEFIAIMREDYMCVVCNSFDSFKKEIEDYLR